MLVNSSQNWVLVEGTHSSTNIAAQCVFRWHLWCVISTVDCLSDSITIACDLSFIWFSNLLIMSVPDKGYSRNPSCELKLMSTFCIIRFKVSPASSNFSYLFIVFCSVLLICLWFYRRS